MAEVDSICIQVDSPDDVSWVVDYNGSEVWNFGCVSITVSDAVSEKLARDLAYVWLKQVPIPEGQGADSEFIEFFWQWLGDAAQEKFEKDGGYIKHEPKE